MLLKFGKRAHLQKIADGKLRFTPATVYQKEEQEGGERGIGDGFDSYLKFKFTEADLKAENFQTKIRDNYCYIICEDCAKIPMLCFYQAHVESFRDFTITKKDFERLMQDFKNPDSFLVIENERDFFRKIENELNETVFCKEVKYLKANVLNYDFTAFMSLINGITSETKFISPLFDGKHFFTCKYSVDNVDKIFDLNRSNSYMTMFFKHDYFSVQREFRLVIPNEQVDSCIVKPISPLQDSQIYDIEYMKNYIYI